jgi:hypothetical protein
MATAISLGRIKRVGPFLCSLILVYLMADYFKTEDDVEMSASNEAKLP